MCVGWSVRVFIYLDLEERREGGKSGAESAVKRDLNTIVPFHWGMLRVQNY